MVIPGPDTVSCFFSSVSKAESMDPVKLTHSNFQALTCRISNKQRPRVYKLLIPSRSTRIPAALLLRHPASRRWSYVIDKDFATHPNPAIYSLKMGKHPPPVRGLGSRPRLRSDPCSLSVTCTWTGFLLLP